MGRAMRQRWISSLGAVALALVSCGVAQGTPTAGTQPSRTPSAAPTPTATPTPTPTATAAPAGTLASCVGAAPASSPPATGPLIAVEPASGETVELVDMAGSVLDQTPIQPFDGVSPVGMGPEGVYLYTASTGELELLGPSGSPQHLAQVMPASSTDDVTVAGSPNGQCWILSDTSWASGGTGTSRLYVGFDDGTAPSLLTTLTRGAAASYASGYRVLRWDSVGVLLGSDPTGVGVRVPSSATATRCRVWSASTR